MSPLITERYSHVHSVPASLLVTANRASLSPISTNVEFGEVSSVLKENGNLMSFKDSPSDAAEGFSRQRREILRLKVEKQQLVEAQESLLEETRKQKVKKWPVSCLRGFFSSWHFFLGLPIKLLFVFSVLPASFTGEGFADFQSAEPSC